MVDWNIEELTGYKPLTDLYRGFGHAEELDLQEFRGYKIKHVIDYFNEVFDTLAKDMNKNYKEFTEFVMVLNWKIWEHEDTAAVLAEVYYGLWAKADKYAQDHMNEEELHYFYKTTD